MKVRSCMSRNVKSVDGSSNIKSAAILMRDNFISGLIVTDGLSPVGIITERDICNKVVAHSRNPENILVEEVMTRSFITASPDDSILEVSRRMGLSKIRQVPIVDSDSRLVGILTSADIIRLVSGMQKDMTHLHSL